VSAGFEGRGRRRRARLEDIGQVMRAAGVPEAPDLTQSILDRVEDARPFAPPAIRHLVVAMRLALVCGAALVSLAVVLLHRAAPGARVIAQDPAPLTAVVQTASSGASVGLSSLRETLRTVRTRPVSAVVPSLAPPGRSVVVGVAEAGAVDTLAPWAFEPGSRAAGTARLVRARSATRPTLEMVIQDRWSSPWFEPSAGRSGADLPGGAWLVRGAPDAAAVAR